MVDSFKECRVIVQFLHRVTCTSCTVTCIATETLENEVLGPVGTTGGQEQTDNQRKGALQTVQARIDESVRTAVANVRIVDDASQHNSEWYGTYW